MEVPQVKMSVGNKNRAGSDFLTETAIFITVGWILVALLLSPLFKVHWLTAGDFKYASALNDQIFIRAHLLYPFLLLPIIFTITLAVGIKYKRTKALPFWPELFIRASLLGMVLGLVGEILWFTILNSVLFMAAIFIMILALIPGLLSLWPNIDRVERNVIV